MTDSVKGVTSLQRFRCPDCGAPNALSIEEHIKGYHCKKCTEIAEGSMAYE